MKSKRSRPQRAQKSLRCPRDELEQGASERTEELVRANQGLKREIEQRKRAEALLDGQKRVLELVAAGAPLETSMEALMRLVEGQAPAMLCSVLLLDDAGLRLRDCAAPSLPGSYRDAIDGRPIGAQAGSCGTAAYRKEPVYVEDIAIDPLWTDYRKAALRHGLRACWSTPIFDSEHRVLGTFAMYYREPGCPTPQHIRLIEMATQVASIAICHHRNEAALRDQVQKIRAIVENSPDLIVRFDCELRRTYVNPALVKACGLPESALLGREVASAAKEGAVQVTEDEVKALERALKQVLDTAKPLDLEATWSLQAGRRTFAVRMEPEFDETGRLNSILAISRDITELKESEKDLRQAQARLERILATLPVGVAVTNLAGDIVLANAATKRIWGNRIIPGKERWERSKGFWHDSGKRIRPQEWASVRALTKGETSLNELIDIEAFDGQQKIIQNSAAPIRNAEGLIMGAVIVNEDVTERVRGEEKLSQTQSELARVARVTMMGELAASIAHEVNQPLAALVTNANACLEWLAASPPNTGEVRKAVQRIVRDGTRAGEIIARVRALLKKGEPSRSQLDLNHVIREVVALVRTEIKRKAVSLQMELALELPRVPADAVQIQQVMLNLIGNALDSLAAVEEGRRRLRISTACQDEREVLVSVEDSGTGIDPANEEKLFDAFFTTKAHGLGMGLTISRSIIEAHGGRLWTTHNPEAGMTFHFVLPVQNTTGP